MVDYKIFVRFIKERIPEGKLKIKIIGKEPGMNLERCVVEVEFKGYNFSFNFGANIIFNFEGSPRSLIKHQNLLNSGEIKDFIENCIKNLDRYKKENFSFAYTIENYARRYFGREKKIIKKDKGIYIYYDDFYIVSSPNIILLALTKSKRTVRALEIKEGLDLDKIFKEFNYYIQEIKQGKIT